MGLLNTETKTLQDGGIQMKNDWEIIIPDPTVFAYYQSVTFAVQTAAQNKIGFLFQEFGLNGGDAGKLESGIDDVQAALKVSLPSA
jgi:hypothetical protein